MKLATLTHTAAVALSSVSSFFSHARPVAAPSTVTPVSAASNLSAPASTPAFDFAFTNSAKAVKAVAKEKFPWKHNIVTTVFWIGEKPTANNPTPNKSSSWDMSHELDLLGVGLFAVGFSPIQNTVVTMLCFHGNFSFATALTAFALLVNAKSKAGVDAGAERLDAALTGVTVDGAATGRACEKNEETDDNATAAVWVRVANFIEDGRGPDGMRCLSRNRIPPHPWASLEKQNLRRHRLASCSKCDDL